MNGAAPRQDPDSGHGVIGRRLGIFATDPLVGSGLPLWLPAGSVIYDELGRLARDVARADGCLAVHTPVLAKRALFEKSGHWATFADDMFPPMALGDEAPAEQLVLRPANCPHHARVYAANPRSYVNCPLRDDGPAYLGEASQWAEASEALRRAAIDVDLPRQGLRLVEAKGEAVFHGPKLDLQVVDGNGHDETIATVRLDFVQPERFDLRYDGADGDSHRVVMIHRGPVGSRERVTADGSRAVRRADAAVAQPGSGAGAAGVGIGGCGCPIVRRCPGERRAAGRVRHRWLTRRAHPIQSHPS